MKRVLLSTFLAFLFPLQLANAQEYPSRAITIVFPFPAGSGLDILTRDIAERLSKKYNQPVIVDNKSGASGHIGTMHVIRSRPDGYTLLLTTNAPLLFSKYSVKMTFDPYKDMVPIIATSEGRNALVVGPSVPVNTVAEFIAYAKANPGKLSYASSGVGTPHHFDGEYLKDLTGIDMVHVPYRGSIPAITDMVSGGVPVGFITYGNIRPYAVEGKVKVLGLVGDTRSSLAPDVPLIRETVPGYISAPSGWNGMFAPIGTPPEIIAKLNRDINEAMNEPELAKRQAGAQSTTLGGPPEALTAKMKREEEVADRLAAKIGLSLQE